MNKLFNYILICTLVISTFFMPGFSNVSAATNLSDFQEQEKFEGTYKETIDLNGVHYFYEDTKDYTLTITKAPNGMEEIAYKDKTSKVDEIYYYFNPGEKVNKIKTTDLKATVEEVKSLNVTAIAELEAIKEKVMNKELLLEKRSLQDFSAATPVTESKENSMSLAASTSGVNSIYNSLAVEYGSTFVNKYLTSLTRNGTTGQLYQHMTFGATPKSSKLFDALTAIGVIATWASTPVKGIIGIASWASATGGYYTLMNPTEFKTWNAYVYNAKEVKVGSIYPYRSNYDITMQATTGINSYAALGSPSTKFKHSDYNSNLTVLQNGIDVYNRSYK